jgi:hypothetical protein
MESAFGHRALSSVRRATAAARRASVGVRRRGVGRRRYRTATAVEITLIGGDGLTSIGTIVAFASMQNRLIAPVAQLLGVSGSRALLDLPADAEPGTRAERAR